MLQALTPQFLFRRYQTMDFVRSYCEDLFLCWHDECVLLLVQGWGVLIALKFFVLKFKLSVNYR